ncbi:hypothetical protein WMF28_39795 [Sorangium sp. So ce590]|uniref:hypothetical protein n=1 Tax=Sorangium sp. So ce590 TaxID=3133317 RepID=UPI003F601400
MSANSAPLLSTRPSSGTSPKTLRYMAPEQTARRGVEVDAGELGAAAQVEGATLGAGDWTPPPPPDAEAIDWADPWTKVVIGNALNSGVFAFLARHELNTLREVVQFRNAQRGRCDPSRHGLAFAAGYSSARRVDDMLSRLIASTDQGGHGLVVRELRRWRGVQTLSRSWTTRT